MNKLYLQYKNFFAYATVGRGDCFDVDSHHHKLPGLPMLRVAHDVTLDRFRSFVLRNVALVRFSYNLFAEL